MKNTVFIKWHCNFFILALENLYFESLISLQDIDGVSEAELIELQSAMEKKNRKSINNPDGSKKKPRPSKTCAQVN